MRLKNIPPPPEQPPDDRILWLQAVESAYPHAPGGRIARVLDVNQRLAQRWANGSQEPTDRVHEYVTQQAAAADRVGPQNVLERLVSEWSAAGMDNESIASHLAEMHHKLVGRDTE